LRQRRGKDLAGPGWEKRVRGGENLRIATADMPGGGREKHARERRRLVWSRKEGFSPYERTPIESAKKNRVPKRKKVNWLGGKKGNSAGGRKLRSRKKRGTPRYWGESHDRGKNELPMCGKEEGMGPDVPWGGKKKKKYKGPGGKETIEAKGKKGIGTSTPRR